MGRLFWKFFFSYWAALLATVVGVAATAWLYQLAERGPEPLEAGPGTAFVVSTAAATLRHGGLPALRGLMDEWSQKGEVWLYAVDAEGHDLLGRPAPAAAVARARLLVAAQREPERARAVRLPNGDTYLLFVPSRSRPLLHRLLFPSGPPSPMVPLVTGLIASLVFGTLLAWYVARPIRHLRHAFGDLSRGRLETRVAPLMGRRRDEVADLGRDFDWMARQIQGLIGAQRSLLHDLSHELRSPLARLQAAIGLAHQNPQKLDASLDRIEREAERLDELVGQILTLSRLEATLGATALPPADRVDVVGLVSAIADDAHFEAESAGRSVRFAGEGEILADVHTELLHRAVENVVRNAVKYTREGTSVDVEVGRNRAGDGLVVRVCDRGPGVPEDEMESIFEPFFRLADGQPSPGFGLGLAITRRAVEAHGGQVHARNREGGGLEVEIDLPLASRSTAQQGERPRES
jgi:two-component system OmpR family sensor kinase